MKSYVGINLPFNLENTIENFVVGITKMFRQNWYDLTTDSWIRNTISGYKVEMENLPMQITQPKPLKFSKEEQTLINLEIDRFIKCGIIEPVVTNDKH